MRKKRWRRRRWQNRPSKSFSLSRKRVIFFSIVVCLFIMLQTFFILEKKLRDPLMNVAKVRIKQLATQTINQAISEKIATGADPTSLVDWKTDHQGKVTGFMLNYTEHLRVTSEARNIVEETFAHMSKFPEKIPLGQAMGSAIIATIGPEIPIKLVPAGAVQVEMNTRKQDAAINMLLVEVYIRIVAEVSIIIPFHTEPEIVSMEIPISYILVKGDVPMYYFDNKGNPLSPAGEGISLPNISLPNVVDETEQETEKME